MSSLSVKTLTEKLGLMMQSRHITCVTAESCTGGGLSSALTAIPGASNWFDRGFVTYSNQAKEELLDVPKEIFIHHGAVSEFCALAMARGAMAHSHADLGVSITGIAGPDGGSVEKPVGTVWIAWAKKNGPGHAEHYIFQGNREQIRKAAIKAALIGLIKSIY